MKHRFQHHLELAHDYWKKLLATGDAVIDATCGNGHDTLQLCQLVLSERSGHVFAYDIQPEALRKTRAKVTAELSAAQMERTSLIQGCHSDFSEVTQLYSGPIKLIAYNLGYFPGGDKACTTMTESTLGSVRNACKLIADGGMITITCYPGHDEGSVEESALLQFCSELPKEKWNCCYHRWINRERSPSLLVLLKIL